MYYNLFEFEIPPVQARCLLCSEELEANYFNYFTVVYNHYCQKHNNISNVDNDNKMSNEQEKEVTKEKTTETEVTKEESEQK